ncbi:unnamed protein product [Bemisia tabaci]|uniref:Bms1-type G domain-containing protein n=1 Tax=Bemisia tabaci TaxID=7038 RepID=A0A9P0CDU2_BEMTA|nr:unnamed protein product [Bemisia tabaci]
MADEYETDKKKSHRERQAGRKAEKKKKKKELLQNDQEKSNNPKAFAINSVVRAERKFRRGQDVQTKKQHIPVVDRTPLEPPPILVVVVGPPKVGKTTLIQCLIKNFTKQPLTSIKGPVTVVSGKKRRITFMECNNDINSMIDLAKVADLVLLLIDASFGFEMEIFEFLNICQVHGMPKIMGVLTHLDMLKENKTLRRIKKDLKHRFWTEVYQGAKLFYLSGILHGEYLKNEVKNLCRFISVMKFRPLIWQTSHPFLIADRMEDLTPPEEIRQNPKCDRTVSLYGYVRGIPLNRHSTVHIPGCGDSKLADVCFLPDPCPLPDKLKKRSLVEKERLIYAPFSGVGGIVYDKDAVYVELAGSHSHKKSRESEPERKLVSSIVDTKLTLDEKIAQSEVQLFSNTKPIVASEFQDDLKPCPNESMEVDHPSHIRHDKNTSLAENDEDASDSDNSDSDDEMHGAENEVTSDDGADSSDEDESDDAEVDSDYSSANDHDESMGESCERLEHGEESETDNDSDSDGSVFEAKDSNVNWKSNLAMKAADAFVERQNSSANLWNLVYGYNPMDQSSDSEDNENEIGGLFRVVRQKQQSKLEEKDTMDSVDSSKFPIKQLKDWTNESIKESIRDCFVTGKWKASEDASELLRLDDLTDEDEELYDDFEDLETGEKHTVESAKKPSKDDDETELDDSKEPEEPMTKEKLMEKKRKLKEKFDAEYDDKTGEGSSYYDDLKQEASKQAELNKSMFEGLEDEVRVELEGFRSGMYVRMELTQMSCELVTNFDPTYPLIVGGLQSGEETIGYVNTRVKKHRWYGKIMKTNNPLIISLGWRRFQTIPVYSKLEDNLRHRMLKYTPEHVTCHMHFWGPITPAGSGLLAVQDVATREPGFRIALTGSVVDTNQTTKITKKLKLTGEADKIFKKTAFVSGMFTSTLEAARFEGAKIRTVSGVRGMIKKALPKPEGAVRATFEDTVLKSDIIFCRTWYQVEVKKFYNPVTSLLLSPDAKNAWKGMKTVGELKRERGIRSEPQYDSMYTPINRKPKFFKPLKVPKELKAALPYKDKTKDFYTGRSNLKKQRVAVVRNEHETEIAALMRRISTNYKEKRKKQQEATHARIEALKKKKQAEELKALKNQKIMKKKIFTILGKEEKKKQQKEARSKR